MNLRTAAFVIASSALFAGAALAQQDDHRNQDNRNRAKDNQSSRSDRRGNRPDDLGRSRSGGPSRNFNDNQPSRFQDRSWNRTAPNSDNRFNQQSRSQDRSWSRPDPNADNRSNDNRRNRSQDRSWSRPDTNTDNRFNDNRPNRGQDRSWSRPDPNSDSRFNDNRPNRGQDRSWNQPDTNSDSRPIRDRWQNRNQNQTPDRQRNRSDQNPGFGRSRDPQSSPPESGFGRDRFQPNRPIESRPIYHRPQEERPTRNRPVEDRGHVQGSQVPQPRPAFGRDWNFGRDRSLMHRNYENDSRDYNIQIVNNVNLYQRPEWGGHWREGYCGWDGDRGWESGAGFRSGNFSFSFYLFTPFSDPCYVSPWYYYTSLPPYIPAERCHVVRDYYCPWDDGEVYYYRQSGGYDSYVDENLDIAIDEIRDGFTRQDIGAIDGLIPDRGRIAVFTDGDYNYSLDANDFHNMMADNIQNTETVQFEIVSVRRSGRNAVVRARHVVRNPDGDEEVVYQQYHLRNDRGHFVITDFMTSH